VSPRCRTPAVRLSAPAYPAAPGGRRAESELDDGTILTDSKLILDYIDAFNSGPELLPRDRPDGWRTLAEMGQALGLLEGIVTWIRAPVPPEPQRAPVRSRLRPNGSTERRMRWRARLLAALMRGGLMRHRSFWARRWVGGAATARMEMVGRTTWPVWLV